MSSADVLIDLWKILLPEPGETLLDAAKRFKNAYPYEPIYAEEGIFIKDRQAEGDEPSVNAPSSPAPGDSGQAQGPVVDTWIEVWLESNKYILVADTWRNRSRLDAILDLPKDARAGKEMLESPGGFPQNVRRDTISGYAPSTPESRSFNRSVSRLMDDEVAVDCGDDEDDGDDDIWKRGYVPAG